MTDPKEYAESIGKVAIKKVKDAGYRVDLFTKYCEEYKKTHDGCSKCESDEGCKKATQLLQVLMLALTELVKKENPTELDATELAMHASRISKMILEDGRKHDSILDRLRAEIEKARGGGE